MSEISVSLLVQLIVPLALMVCYLYGRWLVNRRVAATRIDPDDFGKRGDVYGKNRVIKAKFLWITRSTEYGQIKKIVGYSDDDFSKETWDEFVIVKIRKGDIIFHAGNESHRSFLDRLMQAINAPAIDWETGFQKGTVDEPVILFSRDAE